MFCPNCKAEMHAKTPASTENRYECDACGGTFEIKRREDLERLGAHILFMAELKKDGGPMDSIGDFFEGCSAEHFEQFMKDAIPAVERTLREFYGKIQHDPSNS